MQRLKDKAGNRSNASSEVEYAGTLAIRVGEEGKGIREILSHSHLTRLDFAVGSAGLMRQALTLALRHTMTRGAFGTPIADRPMMTNVLADMAVEVEACTLMALRVARPRTGCATASTSACWPAWPRRPPSTSTARARVDRL